MQHQNGYVGKPEIDPLPRTLSATLSAPDLLLPLGFDQLQYPKLLLGDIRERDRQTDVLCVQNTEASPDESAVRRVHRFFEEVLRATRPMAHVDGLPIRAAGWAAIQFRLRGVSALSAAEDAVGAVFLSPAQRPLMQHRPD